MPRPASELIGLAATVGPYHLSFSRMAVAHSLIWSTSELHTRATDVDGEFRAPLATGPWVAALVAGLLSTPLTVELGARGVTLLELTDLDVRYHAPVFGGDTISASCEITAESDVDEEQLLVVEDACSGHRGQLLLSARRTLRYRREVG